ncbi:HoxN/HupN/NixA family nickel/cobalt transporter [Arthrobacter sp. E3]|uniref:HoxN/HupN/NixA family nickel/cobalt transporter n=1 Tax=Arthrobacter sp. E3 TaxID=517402 RepID=UPI001A950633|nr:HoxN/HupN/NixA family nickel/cobalt transporter [Arthrobacter sp. E3]
MSTAERRRIILMFAAITLLHVVGFAVFILFVVPGHYQGLGIGIAVLAYSLGLRHAFDADHISAIDNTTRKLLADGKRPLSVGFWFSLGHSTIVVGIGVGIVVAEKAVYHALSDDNSTLEKFGGIFGTVISASFLFLIALLNMVILVGILRVFRSMRSGSYDEAELEQQLQNRGIMNRFFRRWTNTIDKEWKMYPLGVVFGLGFDTATEVTLLATTALLASQSLPFYAILCLPILFTAGMTLLDTLDGIFMNFAYSWAFFNPVRKVYYNLAITGLSVAICFFIGGIEVLGLVGKHLSFFQGTFWDFMTNFDTNKAGFVIVGIFVLCWAVAGAYWKFGRVEERWSAGQLEPGRQSVPERP